MSDWRLLAACRGCPTEWWFERERPPGRPAAGVRRQGYERARVVCANCPVTRECLEDAMADERGVYAVDCFGMRGGLTPEERKGRKRVGKSGRDIARSRKKFEEHERAIEKHRERTARWRKKQREGQPRPVRKSLYPSTRHASDNGSS